MNIFFYSIEFMYSYSDYFAIESYVVLCFLDHVASNSNHHGMIAREAQSSWVCSGFVSEDEEMWLCVPEAEIG